ncbi:MAG: uncharacterized protein KVP18_002435, partial [Porospora cf. gigantea A]|uniref:uncharacterized protein n=1 Tax=Porospora cf. gigantea A TaxID=2853593 RepID=UPI00355ABB9A
MARYRKIILSLTGLLLTPVLGGSDCKKSQSSVPEGLTLEDYCSWREQQIQDFKFHPRPRVKFTLDQPGCRSLPDGLDHEQLATKFTVECPPEVSKVTLHFVDRKDDDEAAAVYGAVARISQTTLKAAAGQVTSSVVTACADPNEAKSCLKVRFDMSRLSSTPPELRM